MIKQIRRSVILPNQWDPSESNRIVERFLLFFLETWRQRERKNKFHYTVSNHKVLMSDLHPGPVACV